MRKSSEREAALTADVLRARVSYDPATGIMLWKDCGQRQRIGTEVGALHQGYRMASFKEGHFLVHRLAWLYVHDSWPDGFLDHINGQRSDNRISNLRIASPLQNMANRAAQGGRLLKGVTFSRGKWQAQIRHNNKNIYLGRFDTAEEAHAVYATRSVALHGEFARI